MRSPEDLLFRVTRTAPARPFGRPKSEPCVLRQVPLGNPAGNRKLARNLFVVNSKILLYFSAMPRTKAKKSKQFEKLTFSNGMRVVHAPLPGARAVTVVVLVEAGSKYEEKHKNGISHFLEHMMFNGTKKRPKPLDIAIELDRIGGNSNAFTTHEYTGYWIKADRNHFQLILDIMSDIYINSVFAEMEIEKEKGVIVEEMNMYFDEPGRHVWNLWMELLYGDQPAGWPLIGNKETVRGISRQDLVNYVEKRYRSESTVAVLSGGVGESEIKKLESYFKNMPGGKSEKMQKVKEAQAKPAVKLQFKKTDQAHLVLGVRAFDMFDPRRYAVSVLGNILGSGLSSRLFQRLRKEMGLAYYVGAGPELFTDHGYFASFAGVDTKRAEQAILAILDEFAKTTKELVDKSELAKAKDHIKGSLILNLETTGDLANFYGPQELLRREVKTPDELLAQIEKVNAEDLMNVARDIFREDRLNLALIGPFEGTEKFEKVLKGLLPIR